MAQMREGKPNGSLSIKVDVDTTDAVAELKRLQRVARDTVKDLREVEAVVTPKQLSDYTTAELADELAQRINVFEYRCDVPFSIRDIDGNGRSFDQSARIVVICD